MKILGIIPARYQSSRFEGKPLADICGKPMIWWVYNQCKKVKEFTEVYVATDDERIEKACKDNNINVIMTSTEHKTGTDRIGEVARKIPADLYVNIQGPCFYYGSPQAPLYPTMDHIIPISKGGGHTWENVQVAHRVCNLNKSNKIGKEWNNGNG